MNEKINEIRKHKLPIISLKKVKLVGASRVIVCVQVYAIHFESDEKKVSILLGRYTSFELSISRSLSPLKRSS